MNNRIIVCGGAKSPAVDKIKQYCQEDTILIGVDRGSLVLIEAGYQVEIAIGDFDSVNPAELEEIEKHSKHLERHASIKDDTDMELALELILKEYPLAQQIYIFGAIGEKKGRIDHFIANLWMIYQPRFSPLIPLITFIEKKHVIKFYRPGQYNLQSMERTQYLSIISLTPVDHLSIQGAVYELKDVSIAYPRAYISNEFVSLDQEVSLSFKSGILMVMWIDSID